jgi:hypothetical protein
MMMWKYLITPLESDLLFERCLAVTETLFNYERAHAAYQGLA